MLFAVISLAVVVGSASAADTRESGKAETKYLAFQLFTGSSVSRDVAANIPPSSGNLLKTVTDLRERIGTTGTGGRRLGFILGPLSFDDTDEEARDLVQQMFDISLRTGVACGFHVDDSMFWGRLTSLDTADAIEWTDWNGTPTTGRRLDWSTTPSKIMPQLCFNSVPVKAAVVARAALIGGEVAKGIQRLKAVDKESLFIGIIAGWETQIGRDFDTGKRLGYHALANEGFSAGNPPADVDREREKIAGDFIELWASSLVKSGVPEGKVYSHIAFMSEAAYRIMGSAGTSRVPESYLSISGFTPPETAFCAFCIPGFSTYPQPGLLEQWKAELTKHSSLGWASSEGTAMDPSQTAGGGQSMEGYLGNLFNHGAVLVNLFGWDVGDANNPFRKVAESADSISVYRKFLGGEDLIEAPDTAPQIPPSDLSAKIHTIQALLPDWVEHHDPTRVKPLMDRLDEDLKLQKLEDASLAAGEILAMITESRSPP